VPTEAGLGWVHLLPPGDASQIIEKTGGGAGYTTYIAINQARHIALFLAATDGPSAWQHNIFKGANNLLLTLAGLPPIPPDPPRPALRRHRRPGRRHS
jgi:D-alanyl-D-alanine-carboxypeptidase/D-alanyl-D-alanine-endopeptidase